jgi:hypothetical protein
MRRHFNILEDRATTERRKTRTYKILKQNYKCRGVKRFSNFGCVLGRLKQCTFTLSWYLASMWKDLRFEPNHRMLIKRNRGTGQAQGTPFTISPQKLVGVSRHLTGGRQGSPGRNATGRSCTVNGSGPDNEWERFQGNCPHPTPLTHGSQPTICDQASEPGESTSTSPSRAASRILQIHFRLRVQTGGRRCS